jgi:hypothetical protein
MKKLRAFLLSAILFACIISIVSSVSAQAMPDDRVYDGITTTIRPSQDSPRINAEAGRDDFSEKKGLIFFLVVFGIFVVIVSCLMLIVYAAIFVSRVIGDVNDPLKEAQEKLIKLKTEFCDIANLGLEYVIAMACLEELERMFVPGTFAHFRKMLEGFSLEELENESLSIDCDIAAGINPERRGEGIRILILTAKVRTFRGLLKIIMDKHTDFIRVIDSCQNTLDDFSKKVAALIESSVETDVSSITRNSIEYIAVEFNTLASLLSGESPGPPNWFETAFRFERFDDDLRIAGMRIKEDRRLTVKIKQLQSKLRGWIEVVGDQTGISENARKVFQEAASKYTAGAKQALSGELVDAYDLLVASGVFLKHGLEMEIRNRS